MILRSRCSAWACAVVAGSLLFSSPSWAQSPKPRKWKDASGQFEIEATFVSEANGVVTLKQTNGEEVEIEVKQLSPADEAYIKTEMAAKKSPFKSKSGAGGSSPFQSKSGGKASTEEPSTSSPGKAPETVEIDWTQAALLTPPGESNWKAISIQPPSLKKAKSSQLPAKRDFFENFTGLAVGDGFALLGYSINESPPRPGSNTTRLVRVNLESGKTEGTIVVDGVYALMDVSPGGEQMLMRKQDNYGQAGSELEIWKPAGKVVERQKSFRPFPGEHAHQRSVQTALFGANGRIVALNNNGRAGVFDAATGDPVSTLAKAYSAALSPDRKYAAIVGESLLIVDLSSGEAVASLPTARTHGTVVAFSPDGKRIAVAAGGSVTAWELENGEVYRDETLAGVAASSIFSFVWTSPTHLLVGTTLVDLENHLPLWGYTGIDKAAAYGNTTLMVAERVNQAGVLVASSLPHAAATQALKQALASPGLFAVTPGTAVSVDVSGLPDAGEQQKAKEALEARLVAAGLKPTPGAAVTLRATLTSTSSDEQFRLIGRGLETQTINVTKYTSKVELVTGGQTAWQSSMMSGPSFMVHPKANETLADAVRNSSKPNYAFFTGIAIPQYVMQPGKTTLGSSNIAGF
jgi:hypothetical protein